MRSTEEVIEDRLANSIAEWQALLEQKIMEREYLSKVESKLTDTSEINDAVIGYAGLRRKRDNANVNFEDESVRYSFDENGELKEEKDSSVQFYDPARISEASFVKNYHINNPALSSKERLILASVLRVCGHDMILNHRSYFTATMNDDPALVANKGQRSLVMMQNVCEKLQFSSLADTNLKKTNDLSISDEFKTHLSHAKKEYDNEINLINIQLATQKEVQKEVQKEIKTINNIVNKVQENRVSSAIIKLNTFLSELEVKINNGEDCHEVMQLLLSKKEIMQLLKNNRTMSSTVIQLVDQSRQNIPDSFDAKIIDKVRHLPSNINNPHEQITAAEAKIANRIESILNAYPEQGRSYDQQGIYTVSLPGTYEHPDSIVVHFYKEGYIKHPPLHYMLEQKINSIFDAAADLYQSKSSQFLSVKKQLLNEMEKDFKNIKNIDVKQFHEQAKALMDKYTDQAISQAYKAYKNDMDKPDSIKQFAKKVIKKSTEVRQDHDTLTFDGNTFSFDRLVTTVTAHDREVGKETANLSMVFEGRCEQGECKVTSSIIKHASLPPITKIANTRLTDPFERDVDILISTCNHIEEVAKAMADLRRHGGATYPMNIDWNYQLLTTNAMNMDKQASTYGYTIRAANLMTGASLEDGQIKLTMHVFNAGINKLGKWNWGQKTDTQRRENRKAYLHMNENHQVLLSSLVTEFDSKSIDQLNDIYAHSDRNLTKLQDKYTSLKEEQAVNAEKFNELRNQYNCEKDPKQQKKMRNGILKILDESKKINNKIRHVTYRIVKHQKAHWEVKKDEIKQHLKDLSAQLNIDLKSNDPTIQAAAEQQIVKLSALMYKHYMDEMYYSGKYRGPTHAALFNAYMSAYQHLTGMSASTGCKSGNDRTYVARLLLAAMEGRNLKQVPLPLDYRANQKEYKNLQKTLLTISMSNSAMYSAIDDTRGGAPKVDAKKFPVMGESPVISTISQFGKYAAHKMKSMMKHFIEINQPPKNTSNIFSKLGVGVKSLLSNLTKKEEAKEVKKVKEVKATGNDNPQPLPKEQKNPIYTDMKSRRSTKIS